MSTYLFLNIISCNFTRLEPGIFSDLPSLEDLYISNNELVELDKDLFKDLSSLKRMYLRNNKIAE